METISPQALLKQIDALENEAGLKLAEAQLLMESAKRKREAWKELFGNFVDTSPDFDGLFPMEDLSVREIITKWLKQYGPQWTHYKTIYDWAVENRLTAKVYKNFAAQIPALKDSFEVDQGAVAAKGFLSREEWEARSQ